MKYDFKPNISLLQKIVSLTSYTFVWQIMLAWDIKSVKRKILPSIELQCFKSKTHKASYGYILFNKIQLLFLSREGLRILKMIYILLTMYILIEYLKRLPFFIVTLDARPCSCLSVPDLQFYLPPLPIVYKKIKILYKVRFCNSLIW